MRPNLAHARRRYEAAFSETVRIYTEEDQGEYDPDTFEPILTVVEVYTGPGLVTRFSGMPQESVQSGRKFVDSDYTVAVPMSLDDEFPTGSRYLDVLTSSSDPALPGLKLRVAEAVVDAYAVSRDLLCVTR